MLHEKLICYQESVILAEELTTQMKRWPRGYGYLADQSRRASASIVLNLAEGNAKRSLPERKRFFQIARASAAEVSACLDLMRAFHLVSTVKFDEIKEKLTQISKMVYFLS